MTEKIIFARAERALNAGDMCNLPHVPSKPGAVYRAIKKGLALAGVLFIAAAATACANEIAPDSSYGAPPAIEDSTSAPPHDNRPSNEQTPDTQVADNEENASSRIIREIIAVERDTDASARFVARVVSETLVDTGFGMTGDFGGAILLFELENISENAATIDISAVIRREHGSSADLIDQNVHFEPGAVRQFAHSFGEYAYSDASRLFIEYWMSSTTQGLGASSPEVQSPNAASPQPAENNVPPASDAQFQTPPLVANNEQSANDNRHPFASALSEFFVNPAPVPDWALPAPEHTVTMPFSTHAVLVDVDGNGTQGMLASKWTADVQRYIPHSSAESILVQRLFLLSNNQTRPIALENTAITPAGRLITMSGVDGQGISMSAYTLLGFNNGQLTPVKSVMRTAYGHWEYHGTETWVSSGAGDSYAVNYHSGEFWNRNFEQDQPLTNAEFHQLMTQYGLHGASRFIWELPDETGRILAMRLN
ncbi:MAG: hypothetical protein FWC70_05890 [Defluviitaleaceae bacterium]|nr:hypothetical protein [Defluviitaleaceae bacterium]